MTREIKFRGRRIDNGEWVYGSLINNAFYSSDTKEPTGYIFAPGDDFDCFEDTEEDKDVFRVDPSTVGQFIGLHDKNGREVYEDDVVRYGHNIDTIGPNLGACFDGDFKEGVAAISITPCGVMVGEEPIIFMAEHFCDGLEGNIEELEVIGDIHSNHEFLAVKS